MSRGQRFLVVGADGLIGRSLMARLAQERLEVLGTTRRADKTSPHHLLLDLGGDIAGWRPPSDITTAFLCAAVTSQGACRTDPIGTAKINIAATVAVAEKLIQAGANIVFLSTNLVFDGTRALSKSTDATNPKTEYGRQKRHAEEALLALGKKVSVLRLAKVFHREMPLLKKWADALLASQPIHPLTDLRCSPVALNVVVEEAQKLGRIGASGIFQLSGERDVSYADIALHLAKKLHADANLVQPKTSVELGLQLEHLPAHTTMDNWALTAATGLNIPNVETTLDSVIAEFIAT